MPKFNDYISNQTSGAANYTVSQLQPIVYGRMILVRLMVTCISPASALAEISNNLPNTSRGVNGVLVDGSYNTLPMRVIYEADGRLQVQGGTAGKTYVGTIIAISALDI